jgi:drug/metabolite transporter (DMT)-like permease
MGVGIANGIAAGALWGVVFLAPAMLHSFNAVQLSAGRYLVYGLIAVVLLAPRWRQLKDRLAWPEWRGLLWLSLAGNLVYFLLLATAVQWAGGAAASLIVGLIPVVVTLVGVREQGAVPLKPLLPALGLCMLGVAMVGWEALMSEHLGTPWRQRLIGLLCAFGALFSWALYHRQQPLVGATA